jgi:fibronectin type 3 domain-containing protein
VLLDGQHNIVHVFQTAPASTVSGCAFSGVAGSIYEKTASMDNPVFASGRGTPIIEDSASHNLNNVTTTKGDVNSATGLVVLASNDVTKRYWFADKSLGTITAPGAPTALVASGGSNTVALTWAAPTSTGGSPITGYNVYRGTAPGAENSTPLATAVPGTNYTDSTAVNGTTYYYTVTAVNTVGTSPASGEASATPQPTTTAGYVRRVGTATTATAGTTISVPVGSPGVVAGHTLVVSLLLSSTTSTTGTLSATDTAGNTYTVATDVNDGAAGDRSVVLTAVNAKALPAGNTITVTYPSSNETHLSVDEFSGVAGVDKTATATATGTSFSSGVTATTTQPNEILIGTVGAESSTTPTWATGWTALPTPGGHHRLPRHRLPHRQHPWRLCRDRHHQQPMDGQHHHPHHRVARGDFRLAQHPEQPGVDLANVTRAAAL